MHQDIMSMIGFGAGGVVATALTVTSVNATTSTLSTITAPATINAGDVLVLFDTALGSGLPTNVVPSGFTQIVTYTSTEVRNTVSYKIAAGTEDGSTITGMNGDVANDKVMLRIVPSAAVATVTVGSLTSQITDADPTAQNCTASAGVVPLVVCGWYTADSNISGATRTFSPAQDAEVNSSVYSYVKYKIYNSSPADTSVDLNDTGFNNAISSFYLQVA